MKIRIAVELDITPRALELAKSMDETILDGIVECLTEDWHGVASSATILTHEDFDVREDGTINTD